MRTHDTKRNTQNQSNNIQNLILTSYLKYYYGFES